MFGGGSVSVCFGEWWWCVCVLVSGGVVSVLCVWMGGGVNVGGRC